MRTGPGDKSLVMRAMEGLWCCLGATRRASHMKTGCALLPIAPQSYSNSTFAASDRSPFSSRIPFFSSRQALRVELTKCKAVIVETGDTLDVTPCDDAKTLGHATIETYHDHRMAMCFATLGLVRRGVSSRPSESMRNEGVKSGCDRGWTQRRRRECRCVWM